MMVEHGAVLDTGKIIDLDLDLNVGNNNYNLEFSESITPGQISEGQDYNNLRNKPQINSVTLQGSITLQQLGLRSILYGTTEYWNSQNDLIGEEGTIYIYSDYQTTTTNGVEKTTPGIKIGDGKAFLIDTPFIAQVAQQALFQHVADSAIHTNAYEKNFWNQKITSFVDNSDPENLILSNI